MCMVKLKKRRQLSITVLETSGSQGWPFALGPGTAALGSRSLRIMNTKKYEAMPATGQTNWIIRTVGHHVKTSRQLT